MPGFALVRACPILPRMMGAGPAVPAQADETSRRLGLWLGVLVAGAMLLAPAPSGMPPAAWQVAAVAALMAIWWVSEAIPLTATAFLPFILFPLLGVASAGETAADYYSPILFLLLGGAFVAIAIEKAGLHRRVALAVARRGGATPVGLVLSFTASTALISMLVSNTSTALIMMPVALALVTAGRLDPRLATALVLSVAWGANVGGLGTLVGSPTNAIAAGLIDRSLGVKLSFLDWMAFGLPVVVVAVPLAALVLTRLLRVPGDRLDRSAVLAGIGQAGPLTSLERRVIPVVGALILAWVLGPVVKPLLGLAPVDDAVWAMLAALALFLLPRDDGRPVLGAADMAAAPWAMIMMFGGGLALAAGITDSGLADWIGAQLSALGDLPVWAMVALVVLVVIGVTEFASNVATAAAFMPVVAAVALATGVPALALAMPAALAASWGFMMPAGTGPNAIAYATGRVRVAQMVRTGAVFDLLGVPLLVGACILVASLL
jgi:sodium-dependent dicarboxylate transporter 2/3/5